VSNENQAVEVTNEAGAGYARLSEVFESSARRWELIVYPSLFAFIILAAYGFYLVYNLARDVHYLAISVDTNMTTLAGNMQNVSENMSQLTANVRAMTVTMDSIDNKITTLEPMLANLDSMDGAIQSMTAATQTMGRATQYMQADMGRLSYSVGRPMSVMNAFIPW
jgi:methyl-accepting chemotaxis protein